MSIAEKLQTIAENEQTVFEAGKKSEYDRFWDAYQKNGNLYFYENSFAGDGWHDGTYKPKYPIIGKWGGGLNNTFAYCYITDTLVPIYVDTTITTLRLTFNTARELKTIREIHITEVTSFDGTFNGLEKLENITFVGTIGYGLNFQWSTKLSKASIENIISCLSANTSGLTVTLSQTAVNTAFTDNEWATLIATKPNWTISLV